MSAQILHCCKSTPFFLAQDANAEFFAEIVDNLGRNVDNYWAESHGVSFVSLTNDMGRLTLTSSV